jgi:hypothetical protein
MDCSWESQVRACEGKLVEIRKQEAGVLRLLGDGLAEDACHERLKMLKKQRRRRRGPST